MKDTTSQKKELMEWCQEYVTRDLPSFQSDEEAVSYLSELANQYSEFCTHGVDQDTGTLKDKPIPELNNLTPLQYASAFGFTNLLEQIEPETLKSDRSPNGRNLLHFAAANASLASTRVLLSKGLSPSNPDKDGNCAFHLALKLSAMEDRQTFIGLRSALFKLLCEQLGENEVQQCNHEQENIAHIMATFGVDPLLDKFIQEKSPLLAAQTKLDKQTPLHRAILNNNDSIALQLIKNHQGINTPDSRSNTPLHYACMKGNQTLIDELIKHGADTKARNSERKTPLEIAEDRKKSDADRSLSSLWP